MVAANREDTIYLFLAFDLAILSPSKKSEDLIDLPKDDVSSFGGLQQVSVMLIDGDGKGRVTHDDGGFEYIEDEAEG